MNGQIDKVSNFFFDRDRSIVFIFDFINGRKCKIWLIFVWMVSALEWKFHDCNLDLNVQYLSRKYTAGTMHWTRGKIHSFSIASGVVHSKSSIYSIKFDFRYGNILYQLDGNDGDKHLYIVWKQEKIIRRSSESGYCVTNQ